MMEVFQDYAYYYNSFYSDKDYRAEALQVDFLLQKYGNSAGKIINFGCGTGKHDIELAKMGYSCSGIDISPLMIDIAKANAREHDLQIQFLEADIKGYEPQEQYDAVISLFHVMSYQNSNEDIIRAFQTAKKALREGGVFIFDTWYGPGVLSDKPCVRVKEVQDGKNRLVRIARPSMDDKKNTVDVNYEVFVMEQDTGQTRLIQETHRMRYFFRPELEFLLDKAGFELLDNLDCKTLGETGYGSWTSYFIAKAI